MKKNKILSLSKICSLGGFFLSQRHCHSLNTHGMFDCIVLQICKLVYFTVIKFFIVILSLSLHFFMLTILCKENRILRNKKKKYKFSHNMSVFFFFFSFLFVSSYFNGRGQISCFFLNIYVFFK